VWLENIDNLASWLSPDGEFFPVSGNHFSYARAIYDKFVKGNINLLPGYEQSSSFDPLHAIMLAGWVRVTHVGKTLIAHNESRRTLNSTQKKALILLARQEAMEQIEFDTGEDSNVLWTNS
jgi:hypothetical protein